jgi:LysM repeat protein
MLKYVLFFIFSVIGVHAIAQDADSLFAVRKGAHWAIKYEIKQGESTRMLAQRYYITEGEIQYESDFDKSKKVIPGTIIYIPVTNENYALSKPSALDSKDTHELYYHVGASDDIGIISTYAGVTKSTMRMWNNLHGNTVTEGQVLFIGWLKMISRDTTDNPTRASAYPAVVKTIITDTSKLHIPGGLDTAYNRQTNNGLNVLTEKGTAVFFEKGGKSNAYVAFHNTTPRGTIIKVFNSGTNKTIYVKVLGPIPDTKLYANSIIGICDAAKEALGITDNKAWVELSYQAN